MVQSRPSGVAQRSGRRWSFGDCLFDEANWSLTMRGARVRIESKPLEILRELLLRAGNVVSKDELLDSIWGDVTVVEASLPTAVRKLRIALGDGADGRHFIETVSGIGYRFVAPVEQSEAAPLSERAPVAPPVSRTRYLALLAAAGGGLILMAIVLVWRPARVASTPHIHSEGEVKNALRSLDAQAVNRVIADGWDASKTFKAEGSDALSYVIESCEWRSWPRPPENVDGGARLDRSGHSGGSPQRLG